MMQPIIYLADGNVMLHGVIARHDGCQMGSWPLAMEIRVMDHISQCLDRGKYPDDQDAADEWERSRRN